MATNIAPEVLKLLQQVRQVVEDYENIEEHFAWHWRCFFRELRGRNFLYANEKKDYLEVLVRLTPAERQQAVTLPFVAEPKSMGSGWITAMVKTQEQLDTVKPWLKISYDLSKPFRVPTDCLPGENPQVITLLNQVRQLAHSYGEIEEYFPFGERAFRPNAKNKGQIFLYTTEEEQHLGVKVRLPMVEREDALELPFVEVPKYIGHKGWVAARIATPEQFDTVKAWIQISYELTQPVRKSKAKKSLTNSN